MFGISIFLVFLILTVFSTDAHAYIDPAAGSMLVQVILGAIVGIIFWFRKTITLFLSRVKSFLRRKK